MTMPTIFRSTVPNVSDRFFDSLLDSTFNSNVYSNANVNYDIYSDKENFYLDMELAGLDKKDITIDVENSVLKVTAEYAEKDDKKYFLRHGRNQGQLVQKFKLSRDLDAEKISAKFENGLLQVSIPLKEAALGRKIEIA